jgi:hypothetical protein
MHLVVRVVLATFSSLALVDGLRGQIQDDAAIQKARISGRVIDASGAVIPNAIVTLKSRDGAKIKTTTRAGDLGEYEFATVDPGTYELRIEMPGFRPVHETIEATAARHIEVPTIMMQPSCMDCNGFPAPTPAELFSYWPGSISFGSTGGLASTLTAKVPDDPIKTTLCEIKEHPARYNGKFVEFRAGAVFGAESSWVEDKSCGASASLTFSSDTYMNEHVGQEYAFVPVKADPRHPGKFKPVPQFSSTHLHRTPSNPYRLIWRPVEAPRDVVLRKGLSFADWTTYLNFQATACRGKHLTCPLFEVVATLTGRFDHSESPLISFRTNDHGPVSYSAAGFGPLNTAPSQLVLQSIADVKATWVDLSLYDKYK